MAEWGRWECEELEELLRERLEGELADGEELQVDGVEEGGQLEVRFQLRGGAGGEQVTLAARVKAGSDAKALAIDALDLLLLEYLEGGRHAIWPEAWQQRELRGKSVEIRGERRVPDLEAQADALLAAAGPLEEE